MKREGASGEIERRRQDAAESSEMEKERSDHQHEGKGGKGGEAAIGWR